MSTRHITLGILFVLALLIAIAHYEAFEYFLYWRFWWYDRLIHFAGGLLIAGAVCWVFAHEVPQRYTQYTFLVAILVTALLGTAWEVFEYSIGYTFAASLVPDTRYDMLMNILGALSACAIMGWWTEKSVSHLPVEPAE